MEWLKGTVLRLIEDIRENPCLYTNRSNRDLKNDVVQTLAKKYDCEPIQISYKIRSLRRIFQRHVAKEKETGKKPTWFAYQPLSFLLEIEEFQRSFYKNIKRDRAWTDETKMRFIEDYRELPVLWQPETSAYRYKTMKMKLAAIKTLAKKYNCKAEKIRGRISNLRKRFKVEMLRTKREGIESKWPCYRPLSFLQEVMGEENQCQQNGNTAVKESRSSSRKRRDDASVDTVDTEETDSDPDISEDSEQSLEGFSPGASSSESTDKIASEPEPTVKIPKNKRTARHVSVNQDNSSDEDSKCSENLLPTTRKIPQRKSQRFRNDSVTQDNSSDEDSKFMKSVLPHISRISQNKKLRFRNEVQKMLQEFAYNDSDKK